MANVFSNFESLAGGTTPTTGNTNFNNVTIGAGNTLTTDASVARAGDVSSLNIAPVAAASQFCNYNATPFGAGLQRYGRCYFNFNGSYPASTTTLFGFMTSAFGNCMSVRFSSASHHIAMYNAAGGAVTTGTVAPPSSGWFRIEFSVLPATSTTGQATIDLYTTTPDGTSADETLSTSAGNFGTIAPAFGFVGVANAVIVAFHVSNLAFSDTAALGPDSVAYTASRTDDTGLTDATAPLVLQTRTDSVGLGDSASPLVTSGWAFTHAVTIG